MSPTFYINRKSTIALLIGVWLVLWSAYAIQEIVIAFTGTAEKIWVLDLDSEDSFYTWFSTILLSLAALTAFVLASYQGALGKKFNKHWSMIGGILMVMSIDEMLSFHERVSGILHNALSTSGVFAFAWVIPAIFLVGLVAIAFWPFLRALPFVVARGIFIAGAVYVAGAVGMEMAAGVIVSNSDLAAGVYTSPGYKILAGLEEGLEVLGVLILIRTLLLQAALYVPDLFDAPVTAGPGFDPQPQLAARAGSTL